MSSNAQNKSTLSINTELRHLPPNYRRGVSRILDLADSWKELAAIIKKPDTEDNVPLFSANDITLLEDQKYRMSGSPTQALIEHWSTFGRKRPSIGSFLQLLSSIHLYQAADYISIEVLNGGPVERLLAAVHLEEVAENAPELTGDDITLPSTNIPHVAYHVLKDTTKNFNDTPLSQGGCKLGAGAFGDVYLGFLPQINENVAIKVVKDTIKKQFLTELEILSRFIHENLLPLIGYSVNGPKACLIYKYMQKGSLLDNLSDVSLSNALLWRQRVKIALGTAKGINHLHTFRETPYIHRDIKSANILLDHDLNPKVGDFGLVRIGNSGLSTTHAITTNVIGTPTYMAPEAFRGDVSVKLDTFSFGVVLLELLTSLKPYDPDREENDILSYIEERSDELDTLLDNNVGPWDTECARTLFKIAFLCTKDRKKDRPTITEILPQLENLMCN